MITHFNIITFTLNYVINFEFQNSFSITFRVDIEEKNRTDFGLQHTASQFSS
jgi:hypothetical protein